MRVLLFDPHAGGHHGVYLDHLATALYGQAHVVVAAPATSLNAVTAPIERLELGGPHAGQARRARSPHYAHVSPELREARLWQAVESATGADVSAHLFADRVLPVLTLLKPRKASRVIVLFRPRRHYGEAFRDEVPRRSQAYAWAHDAAAQAWRRRSDAAALVSLDEEAVRGWRAKRGATACWLPEPPIRESTPEVALHDRASVVMFGALAARKGVDLLADAACIEPGTLSVVVAGTVSESAAPYIGEQIGRMQAHGVSAELRARWHSESDARTAGEGPSNGSAVYFTHGDVASAAQSCFVGTPVVAHAGGLIGHLVTTYGLGSVVDARDARALASALRHLCEDDKAWASASASAREFASRYSPARFDESVDDICAAVSAHRRSSLQANTTPMTESRHADGPARDLDAARRELGRAAEAQKRSRLSRALSHPVRSLRVQAARSSVGGRGRSRRVVAETFWWAPMTVYLPEPLSCQIYAYGYFEQGLSTMMLEYVTAGMTVFDIGAHFGYFSLASWLTGTNGEVHCFEPTPARLLSSPPTSRRLATSRAISVQCGLKTARSRFKTSATCCQCTIRFVPRVCLPNRKRLPSHEQWRCRQSRSIRMSPLPGPYHSSSR